MKTEEIRRMIEVVLDKVEDDRLLLTIYRTIEKLVLRR